MSVDQLAEIPEVRAALKSEWARRGRGARSSVSCDLAPGGLADRLHVDQWGPNRRPIGPIPPGAVRLIGVLTDHDPGGPTRVEFLLARGHSPLPWSRAQFAGTDGIVDANGQVVADAVDDADAALIPGAVNKWSN